MGAGIAVGAESGSGKPEVIQVFLSKNLMEAGGTVKVESLRIQGLARSDSAWVGGPVLEKFNAFKFFAADQNVGHAGSCGIGAAVFLVTNAADRLQERDPILGGACFCPRVHCEQLRFHLGRGMLHLKVVDFLSILVPPLLLVVCVVEVSLPFCCLDEVDWVRRVVWEVDGWCLEFPHGQRDERTVKLEAVCDVFGDGFNIQIEDRCRLGGPCVVKNNMLQPLHGRRE